MKRWLTPLVSAVAMAGASYALLADSQADSRLAAREASPRPAIVAPPAAAGQCPNWADLAADVMPAVVSIQTVTSAKLSRGFDKKDLPDFFRMFPGLPMPQEREGRGLGSGFVIEGKGLILTNHHVVENADSIEVTFARPNGDEKTMKAKVVGSAPDYDVALLETEGDAQAEATVLGDSDAIRIGEGVMAIGNPFGLDHSVSVGIISAKERRDIAPSGRRGLYNFLQTDASINPGNSGGPLVNTRGEVVGINSAINAQGQGIGFAIPVNMVKEMLPQLKKGGKFVRSWVGVKIQPLTDELAESYGMKDTHGVLVAEVMRGSPAEDAGIKEGDVVLEFDGKKLQRSSDLPLYASMAGVGKKVSVALLRDGKTKKVDLKLGAFPDDEVVTAGGKDGDGAAGGPLGLSLRDLSPELRERLHTSQKSGAVVDDVERGSAAAKAGLQPGDLVLKVDGDEVKSAQELVKLMKGKKSGQIVRLLLERDGSRLFVALKVP